MTAILAQATSDDLLVAQNIFWWIFATITVFAGFKVVTTSNIVHAALYLVIVLAGVAVQFIFLGSEFAAVTQVLVYIGAIVVLFLFGIMLTRGSLGDDQLSASERRGMGGLVAALLLGIMAFALIDGFEDTVLAADTRNLIEVETPVFVEAEIDPDDEAADATDDGLVRDRRGSDTAAIGDTIFEQYIIPFEAVSVLLLAALIGAIVIARKE